MGIPRLNLFGYFRHEVVRNKQLSFQAVQSNAKQFWKLHQIVPFEIFFKNPFCVADTLFLLILDNQSGSTLDNIEEWRWELTMLLRNKDEQEVVSRERKDRRDLDQLSVLANRMGLYWHVKLI